MRPRTYTAALVFAGTASLLAQASPPGDPQSQVPEPTFRSGVDLAQVDVIVTDEDGNPVTGLSAGDFEILENGEPRAITAFEAIELPMAPATGPATAYEPDVASNDRRPDRVYMFALDEVAPCNALRTRHFLRQFLDLYFGPNDAAAIALVGRGLATDGQDFTSSRRLLLEAIDKFSGGFEPGCPGRHTPPDSLRGARSQQLSSLRTLTESLARIPARRKAMLLFTQRLDVNMFDVVDYNGGVLGLAGEDAHAVLRAATRANITIYPIDPTGLTPSHIPLGTLASLTALGHATGGFALYNSNSFLQTFERIVRESSVYYLLGYDSAHHEDNGRFVRVKVEAKRPGLEVHARDGYVAPSRDERELELESLAGDSPIAQALSSPLGMTGIGIRTFAAPYRGPGDKTLVDIVADIDTSALNLAEQNGRLTGSLEVRFVVTAHRDKSYPEMRYTTTLDLDPAAIETGARAVRVVTTFELPKGRYQVRVAAGTESRAGSVVHDLEVPDFDRAPLSMGGVSMTARPDAVLATFRGGDAGAETRQAKRCRPPLCPDDFLGARAEMTTWTSNGPGGPRASRPGPATTRRDFTPKATLVVFTEIYDNRGRRRRADGAGRIEITTELRDEAGEVVRVARESRLASDDVDRHAVTVRLPLQNVSPGAYALHVSAQSSGDEESRVTRTVPITVTAEE